jgi:hypothetical protein
VGDDVAEVGRFWGSDECLEEIVQSQEDGDGNANDVVRGICGFGAYVTLVEL